MAEQKGGMFEMDDLRVVSKFLSKNWFLILLFPAIAAGVAYFYTHRMPNVYAAKVEILLKPESSYELQTQVYSGLTGFYQAYADITNQKRVLRSHDLIEKTLQKLDFEISYFITGRVKTSEVVSVEAFDVDIRLINQSLYHTRFDIDILNPQEFRLSYLHNEEEISKVYRFNEEVIDPHFILTVNKNPALKESAIMNFAGNNYHFVVNSLPSLVSRYKNSLKINNIEYTSILELSIEDAVESRARLFLDSLSATYIERTLESQKELNTNTLNYIERQLTRISTILDSIETDLEQYKEGRAILDLSREENKYFENINTFDFEKRKLELQLQSIDALEEYILSNPDERLLPPSFYITENDDFLRTSLNELYSKQISRNLSTYEFTEINPRILQGDSSMIALKHDILVYLKNTRHAITSKISDLEDQIRQYEGLIRNIPQSQREILKIERKLQVNEEMFMFLLEKRANTVIARAAIIPQTSIIEKSRSLGVVGPNKQRIWYLFIGGGLALALAISLLRFVLFERIENTRELKQLSKVPVLGGIPLYEADTESRLVVEANPKSNIAESFRAIRTNLQYLGNDSGSRVILTTSLHPGEGKTFCNVNLSSLIAKARKKVILLDFDLHKPKVHTSLGLANETGLSTYLIGKTSVQESIQNSGVDHLDVITAGPIPPNASELVLSEKVGELIAELREHYEYVLIDTPPLLLISDALVLMKYADSSVFVMNTSAATKQGLRYIEEVVESNQLKNISLLLNGIKQKKWKYYYGKYGYGYGYGYGYSYGYGYGSEPEKKK